MRVGWPPAGMGGGSCADATPAQAAATVNKTTSCEKLFIYLSLLAIQSVRLKIKPQGHVDSSRPATAKTKWTSASSTAQAIGPAKER